MALQKPNIYNKENNKNYKLKKKTENSFFKNNSNPLGIKPFNVSSARNNICTDCSVDQISYPCLKFDPVTFLHHRRQQLMFNDPSLFYLKETFLNNLI
jgi:hypothetical protein